MPRHTPRCKQDTSYNLGKTKANGKDAHKGQRHWAGEQHRNTRTTPAIAGRKSKSSRSPENNQHPTPRNPKMTNREGRVGGTEKRATRRARSYGGTPWIRDTDWITNNSTALTRKNTVIHHPLLKQHRSRLHSTHRLGLCIES